MPNPSDQPKPTPEGASPEAIDAQEASLLRSEDYLQTIAKIERTLAFAKTDEDRKDFREQQYGTESFQRLDQATQDAVKRHFGDMKKEDAAISAAVPAASEKPATPERKESRKPPKWQFEQYRISQDGADGPLFVVEDLTLYDKDTNTTETKQGNTTQIRIPESLRKQLMTNPDLAIPFIEELNDLRREIDKNGVKLFLDEATWNITKEQAQNERSAVIDKDGSVKRLFLKWKYQVGDGPQAKDFVDFTDKLLVPDDIVKLLKEDKDYWKRAAWNKWFGPTMQKKREAIISDEVERLMQEGTWKGKHPIFQGPEMDVRASTEITETDETVEAPVRETPQPVVLTTPAPRKEPATEAPRAKVETAAPAAKPATATATPAAERVAAAASKPAAAETLETAPAAADVARMDSPVDPRLREEENDKLTEESLADIIRREVQKSLGAYRFSPAFRNAPEAALKEQVVAGTLAMLTAYGNRPEVVKDAMRDAVAEAVEARLRQREWTPSAHLLREAETAQAPIELRFTALLEGRVLHAALTDLVERALAKVEHRPDEAAHIATSLQTFLASGKKLKSAEYVPGKSFTVTEPDQFLERIRTLHKGLKERR